MVEEKENIVDNAIEGEFSIDKNMTQEEIKADFISAGEDQVILSLNKSYELSGSKKMHVLYYALLASITLCCATITVVLSSTMNNNIYHISGIISEIIGLSMALKGYTYYCGINNISNYTKEAELHILDVKPEAMKDLLQKKYENTTGARIKKLFHRNKKKEEI